MHQPDYFRPPIQKVMALLADPRLATRAQELTGYDISQAGQIRFAP